MKNSIISAMLCMLFVSCDNNTAETVKNEDNPPANIGEPVFISSIDYSSKFEMSNPKYAEKIVQLWDDFDKNNLDAHADYFADTIEMYFPGSSFMGSRDSMVNMTKGYRNSLNAVRSKVDAVMSVKSTDRKEDWVLIWGMEYITSKDGNVDSSAVNEIWRFDNAGKVDYMGQYRRQ